MGAGINAGRALLEDSGQKQEVVFFVQTYQCGANSFMEVGGATLKPVGKSH